MKPFTYFFSIILAAFFISSCQISFKPEQEHIDPTISSREISSGDENLQNIRVKQYDLGKLYFARPDFYGWYRLFIDRSSDDVMNEQFTSKELVEGPGQAHQVIYSHYSDQMAILTYSTPNELWISDVSFNKPQLIFTDLEQRFNSIDSLSAWENLNLVWSPDDLYLFLYHKESPHLSLIYDLANDELEPWYWECNSVVISPKSGNLATLCFASESMSDKMEYAILEWGGEIWFTNSLPVEPFLSPSSDNVMLWEWSPSGEMLAYFDPNDTERLLFIVDSQGNKRMLLSGISLFTESDIEGFQQYEFQNSSPFVWVNGGSILMVEGFDVLDKNCPKFITPYDPELDISSWPCWQAIHVKTGEVMWSESDLANNLLSINSNDVVESLDLNISRVVGSPTSQMIAVQILNPEPRIIVVNLETNETFTLSEYERFYELYWVN